MRKMSVWAVSAILAAAILAPSAQAASDNSAIEVILNGKRISFVDARPLSNNGRVLVPLRVVSENLGAKVDYKNNVVSISQGTKTIKLTVGSKTATVNGKAVTLDSSPYVKSSRVFVPLRFVSEQLGQQVEWDGIDNYVWIGEKKIPLIDDVVKKAEPLTRYVNLFGGKDSYLLVDSEITDGFQVISMSQLPITVPSTASKAPDTVIYKIWSETFRGEPIDGWTVIKVRYSGYHFGLTYLLGDGVPRGRTNLVAQRVSNPDGSFTATFTLKDSGDGYRWGIKNWESIKLTDIKYIYFSLDSKSYVMIKNPFN
ncbi:copper amine oxidase N-terminal domain-containing protein [Cohnella zeiphila]|uniref:Copper amine oxidase N-terminal domain-containing protein n=1 Tax=Cohnella zeiphila TaxID=2761120 RepID=A0A7X0SK68_9BACL|nr:copper amine oxidase N-terminal domain-containing protein [Cohnella zeiphila]MBB6729303.1 copper amine oxidase N-terminal domain-containing protein [Cohnella zeiphila]